MILDGEWVTIEKPRQQVVASMGLTIEDFEDLRNLLEAQVEIEDFHEWVKPYMTGLQSDDTPTQ